MARVFQELKRRNVIRVGIAYLVAAWLLLQVTDVLVPILTLPESAARFVVLLLVIGFVPALIFAWAYELTPEGIKREREVDRTQSITGVTGRKLDRSITVLLVIALGYFVWEARFAERSEGPQPVVEEAIVETEAAVTDKSIAVLPFDNRSSREDDEYFTEGIHDDLLTTIAKIGSMKVISRTSVMEYAESTKNIRTIAQELGVAHILEGGVQRSGNQVRINVQLIDARTDEHLWAEIYDRELTAENLFVIQSEISKAIADALQATLSPEEQSKVDAMPTQSLEAYEAYLLGRQLWRERKADTNAASVAHFQRAIDLDPGFALAYVGLSDTYRHKVEYEGARPEDAFPQAEEAINMALQIDDQLGEAYATLGALMKNIGKDQEAESAFLRAMDLDPNYPNTYNWYGILLGRLGRFEDALAAFQRGLELDPLSPVLRGNIVLELQGLGRFDDALEIIERQIDLDPDHHNGFSNLAGYYAQVEGRMDQALYWQSKALAITPTDALSMARMALWYIELGDFDSAEAWLDRVLVQQPDHIEGLLVRHYLAILRDQTVDATRLANEIVDLQRGTRGALGLALQYLRDIDIAAERFDAAMQRYTEFFPELANAEAPDVNRTNVLRGGEIAYLHLRAGDTDKARQLIDLIIPVMDKLPPQGNQGTSVGNAFSYAMLGRNDDALAEVQRGMDAGVRVLWRYFFDHVPELDELRGDARFRATREGIEADMAEQLARVREMEASGEIIRPEDLDQP